MGGRSQQKLETAAELRRIADQMRWAENRDYLLRLAQQLSQSVEQSRRGGALLRAGGTRP